MTIEMFRVGQTHLGAYVDFETRKVRLDQSVMMPNGEMLKSRWQIFAAGIAVDDQGYLLYGSPEQKLLEDIGNLIKLGATVYYSATREFDEMIAKGRFSNARRAHFPKPVFPSVPGANDLHWFNLKLKPETRVPAPNDIPSKEVPAYWATGDPYKQRIVLDHLKADVKWMVNHG